jgi:hypothetical protein
VSQEQIEKVRRAVLTGMTIRAITTSDGRKRKPIMTFPQLRRVRLESAELNRFIIQKMSNWRSRQTLLGPLGIAPLHGIERITQVARPAGDIEIYEFRPGDFEWLYGLTPRCWPKFARDEVVGDLFLELSERLIRRVDVVKSYVAKHNRDYPQVSRGDFRSPLSLDAPIFADGNLTRGDTITSGLWD